MQPCSRTPSRPGRRLLAGALLGAAATLLAPLSAEARCVYIGAVYSCSRIGAPPIMVSCFGSIAGGVDTCIDATGRATLVGRHWRNHLTEAPVEAAVPATPSSGEGDTSSPASAPADTSAQFTAVEDASFESQLSAALAANDASRPNGSTAPRSAGSTTATRSQPPAR